MPRHIRNIVIAIILAALALAAGVNGYVHHQFKTNIDSTLSAVRPLVQIKYSDFSTSLISGKIKLKNVRIAGDFLPETLNIGDVTFETPGFMYMLNGAENLKKGEFPQHLAFAIDHFFLDLNSETAKWLDKIVNRMQPVFASERKLCGGKARFGPSDYKEMGFTRMLSNMRIAYDFNEKKKTLNFHFSTNIKDMWNLNGIMTLSNVRKISASRLIQSNSVKLENFEIAFKDESYTTYMLNYCSALSDMKKADYIQAEVKQSDEYFYMVWGIAPGTGLRAAYKDFLLKPNTAKLSMHQREGFNPLLLTKMSANEIVDAFNLQLKINGALITDLSFSKAPTKFTKEFERRVAKSIDFKSIFNVKPIKQVEEVKKQKIVVKAVAKYHKINIKFISRHVNEYVHVITKNGNKRNGLLIQIDKDNLYVEKKVSGGKFTMIVPRNKVREIEAYFSK